MSWNVRDEEWLTEPSGGAPAGAIDGLDRQVLAGMDVSRMAAPVPVPPAPQASMDAPPSPPPPPSPAPSYESPPVVVPPLIAPRPVVSASPSEAPAAELDGFHIPTLALGVTPPSPEPPAAPAAPVASVEPGPPSDPSSGLVMPTLSRMKWVPAPEPTTPPPRTITEIPTTVAADVYDETSVPSSTAQEPGQPEVLEQVDSSELELVATEERQSPPQDVDFVIPTLAASPPAPAVRDNIVIPTLRRVVPVEPEAEDTPAPTRARPAAPEVEEVEEVEAEVIESLDATDLVEASPPPAPPLAAEAEESKPRSKPPDAQPQQKRRKAWYDDVFAEHFTFLFPPTWEETAQRDAQFIFDQLGLSEGASVLDVGCGDGRHVIELAKLGLNVTGLDNSLAMLLAAAQHKEASGVDEKRVTFIHGDMRRLPRDREFEAVICVGTTFGYFEEEQNRQCLQEMYERLAVGGRLVLHVFNRDFVAPHLPSRSWWQGRRCMVIDEAEMNFFANRLRVHRTIIFDDGRQYEHFMFMRAYTVQDLGKAMSSLGLRVVEVSGSRDTRARFYGSASPDIWIVAERK